MGILNVTPDSFSGDGLLVGAGATRSRRPSPRPGGWSPRARTSSTSAASRPGPATPRSTPAEERGRVVPGHRARSAPRCPTMPISVDTTKPAVAEAALDAGADLLNDVWGVGDDDALARLAAERGVPLVLMHNRAEAALPDVMAGGHRRPPARARPRARASACRGTT